MRKHNPSEIPSEISSPLRPPPWHHCQSKERYKLIYCLYWWLTNSNILIPIHKEDSIISWNFGGWKLNNFEGLTIDLNITSSTQISRHSTITNRKSIKNWPVSLAARLTYWKAGHLFFCFFSVYRYLWYDTTYEYISIEIVSLPYKCWVRNYSHVHCDTCDWWRTVRVLTSTYGRRSTSTYVGST